MKKRGVNVQPRTGETHGLFGVKFLKYHNIRDPDWTADDLITQYEKISNVYSKLLTQSMESKCLENFLRESKPKCWTAARTRRDQVCRRVHAQKRRRKKVTGKVEGFVERRRSADQKYFSRQRRAATKVQEQTVVRLERWARASIVFDSKAYWQNDERTKAADQSIWRRTGKIWKALKKFKF